MTNVRSEIPSHLHNLIDIILKERNVTNKYQLKVRTPVKPGDNWLGLILEIEVVSTEDQTDHVSFNFIAKLAPTEKVQRNFFPIRLSYEFEIFAYTKILPELIKLQTENNIRNIFNPFANYYQTLFIDYQETIVLENMNKYGYKSVNNQHPVELRHALLIMTVLGKFHALSFVLQKQKPELFKEISIKIKNSFFHSNYGKSFIKITQNIGKQVINHLTKNNIAYKSFENFVRDPSFVINNLLTSEAAGKYPVICHGDYQTRNMLFKYKDELESNTVENMCLLDWQLCMIGSPCLDVGFFIWNCTDKKLRAFHYRELLEIYYRNLSSVLETFGENPTKTYPRNVFEDDLKKFSIYGLFTCVWSIWSNMMEFKNFPNLNSADSPECLIHMLSTALNGKYYARITDVIEDFVKYGYQM